MSNKVDDSKREEIDAALQEAQKQGLPPSWNLVIDVRDHDPTTVLLLGRIYK